MHKRTARFAKGGAIAAAAVVGLTGCGVAGAAGDDGSSADGEVTGDIVFQTWNLKGSYEDYFTGLIDEFEKQHPGTHVDWRDQPAEGYQDKLSADAAAGDLPDVVDMGPEAAYTLASAGLLLDVGKDDPDAKGQYLDTAWDAMTFDGLEGGTYGYPWYLNTGPSFFNTALFDKCGLDSSDLPTTYDELFDQAAVMSKNCDDVSMIGRLPTIETFGMYGSQLMNDAGTEFTFNDDAGVELVKRYQELYSDASLTEESLNALQTGELDAFKSGEVAWLPGSSYTLKDLQDNAPDVYKSVEIAPLIANSAPNMYLESLVVNAQSQNTPTAKEFAKFVTNSKNQLEFAKAASVFPSAAGALDDPFFTKDDGTDLGALRTKTAEQVSNAVVWWPPAFSGGDDVEFLREQIAQAILGRISAKEALDNTVEHANEGLASS